MVGYTGEDEKHYGRRITNPWHDCPPPLFSWSGLFFDMGSCSITVGMVLLLYERGGNPKSYASSRRWLVGWLRRCYTWLMSLSLSSLVFSDHVFYSTHLSRLMFCMLCHAPALVTLFVLVAFPFFSVSHFCIYCILLWRLARRHGWELLRTISRDGRSVGRAVGMYRKGQGDVVVFGIYTLYSAIVFVFTTSLIFLDVVTGGPNFASDRGGCSSHCLCDCVACTTGRVH